jgi:peptidoglycan/xylan/chitin deacetylase (PgdA/CDA1 family)
MPRVSLLFHDVFVSDPRESGFASTAADRYKLSIREFDAQLAGLYMPPKGSEPFGGAEQVRLTFDDGGESFYSIVADKLETRGVRGHCFVTTGCIGQDGFLNRGQIRELHGRGHIIGSHSVSHPTRFGWLSREEMRREWTDSRKALEDILGRPVVAASVPGGYFSHDVGQTAAECGFALLFNSEPVRSEYVIDTCTIAGRFAIRSGAPADLSRRLAQPAPWTRSRAWASWTAKGLVKPLLGSSYPRVADWIYGGAR